MGFFKKVGGAISSVAKVAIAPVVAPVQAVVSVSKGDVGGAASKLVGGLSAATSPLVQAEKLSGGSVSHLTSYVPVIGSPLSKMAYSGADLAFNKNPDSNSLKTYVRESGKSAALVYGGTLAAGALKGATAAQVLSSLAKGNNQGAAAAIFGEYAPSLSGLSSFIPNSNQENSYGYGSIPEEPQYTYENGVAVPKTKLPTEILIVSVIALGVFFIVRKK